MPDNPVAAANPSNTPHLDFTKLLSRDESVIYACGPRLVFTNRRLLVIEETRWESFPYTSISRFAVATEKIIRTSSHDQKVADGSIHLWFHGVEQPRQLWIPAGTDVHAVQSTLAQCVLHGE